MTQKSVKDLARNYKHNESVSVIIPVYNGALGGLEECLKSVISQTHPNVEVVVVDDCSTDTSTQIVEASIVQSQKSIRLIRHSENLGLSSSWNDGIASSSGKLILLLQQDCVLLERFSIEKGVKELGRRHLGILTGKPVYRFDELNMFQMVFEFRASRLKNKYEEVEFSANKCDLVKRTSMAKIGKFSQELPFIGQDWLFASLARKEGIKVGISDEFGYRNLMIGEDNFSKIFWKEFNYSREAPRIARVIKKTAHGESAVTGSSNLRRRLLITVFPMIFDFGLLALILSWSIPFFYFLLLFVLIWGCFNAARFHHITKELGIRLKSAMLYGLMSYSLDEAYLIGLSVGALSLILHRKY